LSFLFAAMVIHQGNAHCTEKDYERTNNIDRQLAGKVWHSDIRPVWVGKADMLVFEDRAPAGKDYILSAVSSMANAAGWISSLKTCLE